jgi:hypothetical protein
MEAEWNLLVQWGLPLGAACRVRRSTFADAESVRHAVDQLAASDLDPFELDALAAWMAGFRQHWPSMFARVLGDVGESVLRTLMPNVEANRYLKLRRLAIANLSQTLRDTDLTYVACASVPQTPGERSPEPT